MSVFSTSLAARLDWFLRLINGMGRLGQLGRFSGGEVELPWFMWTDKSLRTTEAAFSFFNRFHLSFDQMRHNFHFLRTVSRIITLTVVLVWNDKGILRNKKRGIIHFFPLLWWWLRLRRVTSPFSPLPTKPAMWTIGGKWSWRAKENIGRHLKNRDLFLGIVEQIDAAVVDKVWGCQGVGTYMAERRFGTVSSGSTGNLLQIQHLPHLTFFLHRNFSGTISKQSRNSISRCQKYLRNLPAGPYLIRGNVKGAKFTSTIYYTILYTIGGGG